MLYTHDVTCNLIKKRYGLYGDMGSIHKCACLLLRKKVSEPAVQRKKERETERDRERQRERIYRFKLIRMSGKGSLSLSLTLSLSVSVSLSLSQSHTLSNIGMPGHGWADPAKPNKCYLCFITISMQKI